MGDDRIELRGLRLLGICGVLPEELHRAQPLEVDIDVVADLSAAGRSDELADTIDYGAVCSRVEMAVTGSRAALLEHLAERIAAVVLALDGRITAVTVGIRKLRPPVAHDLATSGVCITRHR